MRIRLWFNKENKMRFVSHLEFMKFFERYLRRCNITFTTTQGFHKRAKMAFGPASPFGMTLLNEPVDVEIADSSEDNLPLLLEDNSDTAVKGFKIVKFEKLEVGDKLSKKLPIQIYEVKFLQSADQEKVEEALKSDNAMMYTLREKERNLKENLVGFCSEKQIINLHMETTTPTAYFKEHYFGKVEITRVGYKTL